MTVEQLAPCLVKPRRCTFQYTPKGLSQNPISFVVEIPLSEFQQIDEYIAHIITTNNIVLPLYQDVADAFRIFVTEQTQKYEEELGDALVEKLMQQSSEHDDNTCWVNAFSPTYGLQNVSSPQCTPSFSEKFQFVMRNSSHQRIEMIISMEKKMFSEMSLLIRTRDLEMEMITRECENAVGSSGKEDGLSANEEHLCRLNDRIREVNENYSRQIQALADQHRYDYRKLISSLFDRDEFPPDVFNNFCETSAIKKSVSAVADIGREKKLVGSRFEESFTIYLGAQLKTMHNARLLTTRRLSDLCRPVEYSYTDAEDFETRRLQINLSLYRRGLNGLLLLVDRNPYFHIHNRTDFAKMCELSTELHFDSLEKQLEEVFNSVNEANKHRFGEDELEGLGDYILNAGDVYLTKHSNLKSFQAIFHMVVDDNLETEDISSRHPCINGLKNIIRLASKFGITTIGIPLLLVEKTSEKTTVAWCLKRAELVFKCVKGFMMEVCAGNSMAGGGPPAAVHYNVNFILPNDLAENVYTQIIEMFPTIFHLVPSVVVE